MMPEYLIFGAIVMSTLIIAHKLDTIIKLLKDGKK